MLSLIVNTLLELNRLKWTRQLKQMDSRSEYQGNLIETKCEKSAFLFKLSLIIFISYNLCVFVITSEGQYRWLKSFKIIEPYRLGKTKLTGFLKVFLGACFCFLFFFRIIVISFPDFLWGISFNFFLRKPKVDFRPVLPVLSHVVNVEHGL